MSSPILNKNISNSTQADSFFHPKYRPDIDGLRAISIFAVVAYHAFPTDISGGFVGVDVFFVISGFLISTIIFNNLNNRTFSFYEFYIRRIKRIFPALILVLFTSFVFGWYTLFTDEYKLLGKHMAASTLFLSNIALWGEAGYFDSASELKPLLHLWSLGVEEQFYIIWPLIIYLLWKLKFGLLFPIVFMGGISFYLNIHYVVDKPTAVFYFPISRFWELLAGGFLAYVTINPSKSSYLPDFITLLLDNYIERIKDLQSVLGIVLILYAIFAYDQDTVFPGWAASLPVIGAFLLISAGANACINRIFLSNPTIVWFGLISYPLYLWHWPFFSFSRIVSPIFDNTISVKVLLILVSVLFAWLTYRYVEVPVRRSKSLRIVMILVALMGMLLVLSLYVFKQSIAPRVPEAWKKVSDARLDRNAPRGWLNKELQPIVLGDKSKEPSILFFGDSHMEQYYPRIHANASAQLGGTDAVIIATAGGCPPINNVERIDVKVPIGCPEFFEAAMTLALSSSIKKVVLGAYWDGYFLGRPALDVNSKLGTGRLYHTDDHQIKTPVEVDSDQYDRLFEKLERSISLMKKEGKEVYIILSNPASVLYDPQYYIRSYNRLSLENPNPVFPILSREEVEKELFGVSERLRTVAERTGAIALDPLDDICSLDVCVTEVDGIPINQDVDHLSSSYVLKHIKFLDRTFTD